MSEHDDLEELVKRAQERRFQALEHELDRRLSRLWRAPERQLRRRVLKPALAVASVALLFVGAWLYDLSQSWKTSSIVVLDARYERPQLVLRESGDPVRLTQQVAGVLEQAPPLQFDQPSLFIRDYHVSAKRVILEGLLDEKGSQFFIMDSTVVKITPRGERTVIAEDLDDPSSLTFDSEGNLLILESGKGRILRVEAIAGEIEAGSPIAVFAEGFASSSREREGIVAESRSGRLEEELKPEERVEPVYLTVNESGEIFIGGQAASGEVVVYKIGRKSFKWWKFYCLYQC